MFDSSLLIILLALPFVGSIAAITTPLRATALVITSTGGLCLFAGVPILGHVVRSYDLDDVLAARGRQLVQRAPYDGEGIMFDLLKGYAVDALNWHIGETPPSIADYRASGGATPIVGGLQRGHITWRDLPAVIKDVKRTLKETHGRGILIAPACVIRYPVDDATLQATVAEARTSTGP